MSKKLVLASAILATAVSSNVNAKTFEGFYVGLQSPVRESLSYKTKAADESTVATKRNTTSLESTSTVDSLLLGDTLFNRLDLNLGYGFRFGNEMYAAFEVTAPMFNTYGDTNQNFGITTKTKNRLKVTGILGKVVNDKWLFYGLAGYNAIQLEQNASNMTGEHSTTLNGIRFGAGFEYAVLENLGIGAEFSVTEFGKGAGYTKNRTDAVHAVDGQMKALTIFAKWRI